MDEAAIQEFRSLYYQQYGMQLTKSEAIEYGSRLIAFVKAVYGKNIPKVKIDKKGKQ